MWLPICAYTSPFVSYVVHALATAMNPWRTKRLSPSSLGFVFLQDLWLPHQTRRQCLDTSIRPTRLSMKKGRVRVGRLFSLGVACLESKCFSRRSSIWKTPYIFELIVIQIGMMFSPLSSEINKGICIGFRVWPRCLPRLCMSFLSPSCTCCPGSVKAKDKYWW